MHTHAVANCNHLKSFKINLRIPKAVPIQPTSFGQFLKKLRTEKQLSQRELARLLKVSHDSIRNWERDRFLPGKESIIKLAKVFQIDQDILLSLGSIVKIVMNLAFVTISSTIYFGL